MQGTQLEEHNMAASYIVKSSPLHTHTRNENIHSLQSCSQIFLKHSETANSQYPSTGKPIKWGYSLKLRYHH